MLRLEYLLTGRVMADAPEWAGFNSGVMIHSQSPMSMTLGQLFPVSLEGQFLAVRPLPGFRLVVTATAYVVVFLGAALPAFVTDPTPLRRFFDQRVVAAPEYQTRWMADSKLAPWALPPDILRSPAAALASGDGRVDVEQLGSRRIVLRTSIETPEAQVRLRMAYFPGWVGGGQVEPVDGLVGVTLYKGQARVELTRPYFAGEREGLAMSLVTLGVVFLAMAARLKATTEPEQL